MSDLRKHLPVHTPKTTTVTSKNVEDDLSEDEDNISLMALRNKKKKAEKKYACHLCPEKAVKIFSRGSRLTTHLVKVHGAQWSFGHSRFRYQKSTDGMYRLTTTRFEYEDISKKIEDGYSGPKESINNTLEFDFKEIAEATETTPKRFEITLKNNDPDAEVKKTEEVKTNDDKSESNVKSNAVEIMMCDVDEDGNIINSETIESYQLLYEP